MAERSLEEIRAVGVARGVAIPADAPARILSFIEGVPHGAMASMQRDIMEGRPSELESQNGAVLRIAAEHDVDVPTNAFLYASLLPQECAARGGV
jgi:2-dehydropantoate 2-reductase